MVAMGRLIKQAYNPEARVVFIGPCAAKKAESKEDSVAGAIDAVLTFAEIKEMFTANKINPEAETDEEFSGPKPNMARLFAISGGLLQTTGLSDDILHNEIINAHGQDYVISSLAEIAKGEINSNFVNFFFCHGCIDGPAIDNDLSVFRRRELVAKYAETDADPEQTERDLQKYAHIDLSRQFKAQNIQLSKPTAKEVHEILKQMGKSSRVDQFNCGACGYKSCKDLLAAGGREGEDFTGPLCIFQAVDLGIALGSAAKLAGELNIDNRMMYSVGAAAKKINLLDSDLIVGIPLSVTGKNPYFDRP